MSIKKAFLLGALSGVVLASFLLLAIWIRPFPVAVNSWLERATFRFCPFYVLIFMNVLHAMWEVVVATIFGNAVLYGLLGVLLALTYKLIRWSTAGSVPP